MTQQQLVTLQNVTDLMKHTFVSQFVFPVLGREDSQDPIRGFSHTDKGYRELSSLWRNWLPTEAIHTFTKGTFVKAMVCQSAVAADSWVGGLGP